MTTRTAEPMTGATDLPDELVKANDSIDDLEGLFLQLTGRQLRD